MMQILKFYLLGALFFLQTSLLLCHEKEAICLYDLRIASPELSNYLRFLFEMIPIRLATLQLISSILFIGNILWFGWIIIKNSVSIIKSILSFVIISLIVAITVYTLIMISQNKTELLQTQVTGLFNQINSNVFELVNSTMSQK